MSVLEQIESAYREMATKAKYRPAAPSDGLGNITVALEQLNLPQEASKYARQWWKDEDEMRHFTGTCNYTTRKATIFAIEAARNMCGGDLGNETALRLLKMAVSELENLK